MEEDDDEHPKEKLEWECQQPNGLVCTVPAGL